MKLLNKLLAFASCCLAISLSSCSPSKTRIQILMTSDMHGMLVPYDYASDVEVHTKGSLSQIGTAIESLRDNNTLLIDCGDAIQGNYSNIFVEQGITHPMIEAMNILNYDVFVTGNHEYNYGMDYLKDQLSRFNGTVLTGNVVEKTTYKPLADSFKIFNKGGVRVAVIGMVTPLIKTWDSVNLKNWIVTDAINETIKVVKIIKDNNLADVIVAAEHLGLPVEYGEEGTSCIELAKNCPDIDVILASHQHKKFEQEIVNGVLICENPSNAQTMMKVDIEVEKGFAVKPKLASKTSKAINAKDYKTNSTIDEFAKPYHEKALAEARTEIGTLSGDATNPDDYMRPGFEITQVPSTYMQPTPLVNIVNKTQLAAAKEARPDIAKNIKVTSTAIGNYDANLPPGKIKKSDCSKIYKYENTLYILKMNGLQLRKYIEWTAQFYNKSVDDDLTVSFNADNFNLFNYDMFSGVKYTIDITKDPLEGRVTELKWDTEEAPDVQDGDEFYMAINNYRAQSHLLTTGKKGEKIFQEGDELPTLIETDLLSGKGIREMLVDYIKAVCAEKGGSFSANDFACSNWEIVHNNWTKEDHNTAVNMINSGQLDIGKLNTRSIKLKDIGK